MTGPDPADQWSLRANDLDRSMVATALDSAYADGELGYDEYQQRLTVAKTAATRGDLIRLVHDLQVPHELPALPQQLPPRAPAASGTRGLSRGVWVALAATVVAVGAGIIALSIHQSATPATSSREALLHSPTSLIVPTTAVARPDYSPADHQLVAALPTGYGQNNCSHQAPTNGELAALICGRYPGSDISEAHFYLYADGQAAQQSYDDDRNNLDHVACADGATDSTYPRADSTEIAGHYECFTSTGTNIVPSLEWTSAQRHSLGVAFASDANGNQSLLDWWRSHGQFN